MHCFHSVRLIKILLKHKAEPRNESPSHKSKCASQVAREYHHEGLARVLEEAEANLEQQRPIRNRTFDQAQEDIQNLKRLINDEVGRSMSPDSPSPNRACDPTLEGLQRGRPRRRFGSAGPEAAANLSAPSPSSSTPRMLINTPMIPSPLGQDPTDTIDTYAANTFPVMGPANIIPEVLHGTFEEEFLSASGGPYSHYLGDGFR